MIIKIISCLYCDQEMESITTKNRFCSDKCRVYYNRQNRDYNGGFVYCLRNPLDDNKVFYVGKTICSLSKRLNQHKNDKNQDTEKGKVIKLILDSKMDVIIEEIEFVDNVLLLDEREKYWIKNFSDNKLLNISNYKKCKSNPIGVRFDLYKLDMIQKEQNLTSVQQVVNYLMDNYGKIKPVEEVLAIKPIEYPKKGQKSEIKPQNGNAEPPEGLTGIDLAIWKSENWK